MNNLKQIGLALLSYHGHAQRLPMSAVDGSGHGVNQSCFALFSRTRPAADVRSYNFRVENFHAANSTVVGTQLSTFLCPETPLSTENPLRAWCSGPTARPTPRARLRPVPLRGELGRQPEHARQRFHQLKSSVPRRDDDRPGDRPERTDLCVRVQDVRDGMGNTIMFGEKRDSQGWNVGGYAGSEFDVAPSPYIATEDPLLRMIVPGSYHAGQVHFLFCDGAVHPLRSTANRTLWYAMITRDGKENISTDSL